LKFKKRSEGADAGSPLPAETPKSKQKTQESVIIYIAILFTVAFLLILLSYFMQQRRSEDTISTLTQTHNQFSSQALENIEELQNKNLALQEETETLQDQLDDKDTEISELEGKIADLEAQIAQLRLDWAADVKSVTDQFKVDVNREAQRSMAVEAMYTAREKLAEGDISGAKSEFLQAEHYKSLLDKDLLEKFEKLSQDIKTAEDTTND